MNVEYFNNLPNTKKILLKITLIGILSALSYVGVLIQIPIPSPIGKPMIHLGNLIVIISALLFGGIIGGASGSIGMGLYDLIHGYDIFSIIRTIILKLVMGLIVGFVYRKLLKDKNPKVTIYQLFIGIFFILIGSIFLIIAVKYNGVWGNSTTGQKATIYWPIYSFSLLIGILFVISFIFTKRLPYNLQIINLATSIAIIVNIFGEFIYKVVKQLTMYGTPLTGSMVMGLMSIPATLLNGIITLVIVLSIYLPISSALYKKA